jgi:hypothetical protein
MRLNALIVPLGTLGDINLEWWWWWCRSRRSKFHQVLICQGEFQVSFSIVMDHNQSWTGRGAFELGFNQGTCYLDRDVKFAAQVCACLHRFPVEQLLVEDGRIEYFELSTVPTARYGMTYLCCSTTSKPFVLPHSTDRCSRATRIGSGSNAAA